MFLLMQNNLLVKKILIVCLIAVMSFLVFSPVLANGEEDADPYGLATTAGTAGLEVEAQASIPEIIGMIIGTLLSLVGVLFLILIIYGGIMWMMAGGNAETVKKAANIMKNAAIGLILVMAAYALTSFIFGAMQEGTLISTNS